MTTITKNKKTGRVIIEEDGFDPHFKEFIEGAPTCKVSVSADDFSEIETKYTDEYGIDFLCDDFWEALKSCKSYHVIRKECRID